jgi:hypothetical protein
MAATQNKHSLSRAQGSRRRAHASTKPQAKTKSRAKTTKSRTPPSLRYTETKRGKTTIRRYTGRSIYRFEEIKGKPVDCVEIYTGGGHHAIDVCFEDKTTIHFTIEPGFTLEAEYADWKTGDWRPIKRWPIIRSIGLGA